MHIQSSRRRPRRPEEGTTLTTLGHYPPAAENAAAMGSIPGIRFTEGVVVAVDGTETVGPEAASAVLVLQNSLDSDTKAQQFWARAAVTLKAAQQSDGFIRFIAFDDGLCSYALGFWRSRAHAVAFRDSQCHREAMRELDATGNQYSHFAGLYTVDRPNERHAYCGACLTRNVMPRDACASCGHPLADAFRIQHANGRVVG